MCRRASVGQPRASRNEAMATTGPTLQREPGSHQATMVATASRVTVRVPIPLGTCRVARVSRRRPRFGRVRDRVGGVEVITLPWSHMCAPDEAGAARAGRLSRVRGGGTAPHGPATASAMVTGDGDWTRAVAHAPCGLMHAATGCGPAGAAVKFRGTPDRYAPGSKLCRYERPSRRQAHSVRRALSSLCADDGA